jgi:DNA-binding beta-propeller fold protein YncE
MRPATAALLISALLPPLAGTAAKAQDTTAGFSVARRIPIGGEGGWDYLFVDTTGNRLYVSHSTRVVVVDLGRDSVVGEIPNTPGVHGIAVARELGRGFTSNGRDSTVTVFDLATLATIARVNVQARNPDAIFYDPGTRRVFTFNGGSANATAIDAASGTVLGLIPLGGKPETAVSDGATIYVNVEDRGEIAAFDPRTLQEVGRWSLAPCQDPTGLAIDRAHHRLFAACGNRLMAVSDPDGRRLLTTLPIGAGADGAAFDAALGLAFSSNGEGTITVVREESPDRFTVVGTVPTQHGARTIALDTRTHRLYLSTAELGPAPAPTAENPRPRPTVMPGSFVVLVVER